MKIFTNIIQKIRNTIQNMIKKELPRPLGRWKIEDCNTKTNNKIDLSNEDHCGPCGQYALDKVKLNNKRDNFSKLVQTPQTPQTPQNN